MAVSTVRRRGTDSSGRGIYATDFMWDWWENQILADPRLASFRHIIVITQGAWQVKNPGGGAKDSKGYHDGGGPFDLRTRTLTLAQVLLLILVIREKGGAAYLRNIEHGGFTDPHIHFVLGADFGLSDGARFQWAEYLAGRDGLKGRGPDYHPRPSPLVTKPPEDDMFDAEDSRRLERVERKLDAFRKASRERDRAFRQATLARLDALVGEVKDDATKAQVRALRGDLAALAEPADDEV